MISFIKMDFDQYLHDFENDSIGSAIISPQGNICNKCGSWEIGEEQFLSKLLPNYAIRGQTILFNGKQLFVTNCTYDFIVAMNKDPFVPHALVVQKSKQMIICSYCHRQSLNSISTKMNNVIKTLKQNNL